MAGSSRSCGMLPISVSPMALYTVDPDEDTEALAADDLSRDAGPCRQCRNGCRPALPNRVSRRNSGTRGPSVLIHGRGMTAPEAGRPSPRKFAPTRPWHGSAARTRVVCSRPMPQWSMGVDVSAGCQRNDSGTLQISKGSSGRSTRLHQTCRLARPHSDRHARRLLVSHRAWSPNGGAGQPVTQRCSSPRETGGPPPWCGPPGIVVGQPRSPARSTTAVVTSELPPNTLPPPATIRMPTIR